MSVRAAIPPAVARRLLQPPLSSESFATEFHSAEDKAWFGNALLKFIAEDFPEPRFTLKLYRRLHNCFGYIALYDRLGFFETYFLDAKSKIDFIDQMVAWPTPMGSARCTFSDVEHEARLRVARSNLRDIFGIQLAGAIEACERAEFDRLKQKFDRAEPAPLARAAAVQIDLFGPDRA